MLVGRCAELNELVETARLAPAVVMIEGEAGVGKSRLVRELLRHPDVSGRPVLFGACVAMRAPFPYGPVVEALRQTAGMLTELTVGLNPVTGALRPLLPELADHLPAPPPPADPTAQRHQMFRGVWHLLASLGPTILVVEDLHWADPGTEDLLRFLTYPPPPDLTIVLTYRREDLNASGTLPRGGGSYPEAARSSVLLRPLDPIEVRQLAANLLRTNKIPIDFAEELHRRTAGIPLVIEEVLHGINERAVASADNKPLSVADLATVNVPLSLRDTMSERIARLGPTVGALAHAAAVLEVPSTEAEIAAVTGLPQRRIATALVRALQSAILYEIDNERYGFRHPLAREAVYGGVPGPQRGLLHARAAEVLGALPTPPEVQLAHHYRLAGDIAKWVRHTIAAVDHANTVGDTASAIALLEKALTDPDLPVEARDTFALQLSREALQGIAHTSTIARLRAVLRDEPLSQAARGEVRLNLGRLLINQAGQMEAGQAEIEMAVPDLHHRPKLAARGMATLGLPTFGAAPIEVHMRWLVEAERITQDSPDPELVAAVRANRISTLMGIGDPAVWEAIAALPTSARSVEVRRQLARTYTNLADSAAWIGHFDSARDFLVASERLIAENDEPFLSMLAEGTRLRLDAATGNWTNLAADGTLMIEKAGDMDFLAADAWLALAWLALGRGERALATKRFTEAQAAATGNAPLLASACAGRVTLSLAQGEVAAACVEADRGVARIRRKGNWVWAAELAPVATQALIRGGRLDDAVTLVAEYRAGIAGRDAPLAIAAADACRGILAGADGDNDEAARRFTHAGQRYAALPHPHAAAKADEAAARFAEEAGDRATAIAQLTTAVATFTVLAADRDAARCKRTLGRYESGARRRGRKGYGSALSPREREVASLAAKGMTNRQIAAALFLSPRTVEQHVAKSLRKLGLQSRAALSEDTLA